jgi:hypothetical protein
MESRRVSAIASKGIAMDPAPTTVGATPSTIRLHKRSIASKNSREFHPLDIFLTCHTAATLLVQNVIEKPSKSVGY